MENIATVEAKLVDLEIYNWQERARCYPLHSVQQIYWHLTGVLDMDATTLAALVAKLPAEMLK